MNLSKLLLVGLFLAYAAQVNAQSIKPKYKSLTYVTYEKQGAKAIIKDLLEIDGNGMAHYRSVWYNGIADTIYRLADDKIERLNKVFDGKTPLAGFVKRTKLPEGSHYGGSFDYLIYTDTNNKIRSLTIVSPFMSTAFNEALDELSISPSKISYKGKVINNPALSNQILLSEKRTTYLPKVEEPPTVKELPAGPPR